MKNEAVKQQKKLPWYRRLTYGGSQEVGVEEEKPAEKPRLEKKGSAEKKLILRFKRNHG
jgi:hypothetical protein